MMQIGVLGVNHKSSEIEIREMVAKACHKRLKSTGCEAVFFSAVVLSTCHRTEIYFSTENLAQTHSDLLHLLKEEIPIPFEHTVYSYFGIDCFLHLARVVAGLDSVILIESEILRQVKVAYEKAQLDLDLPSCLHYLFQKALKIGKEVRSTTPPHSLGNITIPKMLFQLSSHLLKDLKNAPILLIGHSEINRKIISHFRRKQIDSLHLCTRSIYSARELARKENLQLLSWEERDRWGDFKMIISGSNASHYVIDAPPSRFQTEVIFDLSVPRNVNPTLDKHPQLTLVNMERLSGLLESAQRKNEQEMKRIEALILKRVERYALSFHEKTQRSILCNS